MQRPLTVGFVISLCALTPERALAQSGPATELMCGDSLARRAVSRPAATRTAVTSSVVADTTEGAIVVRIAPRDSLDPGALPQVQLWGRGSGAGSSVDSAGVLILTGRPRGLSQLAVRARLSQSSAWLYAVTVRAGYADTVSIDLSARCTRVFVRPGVEASAVLGRSRYRD